MWTVVTRCKSGLTVDFWRRIYYKTHPQLYFGPNLYYYLLFVINLKMRQD